MDMDRNTIFLPVSLKLDNPMGVFIPSPVKEGSSFFGDTGVYFIQRELKPVRRVCADVNVKIFQHKVHKARRKPTLTWVNLE